MGYKGVKTYTIQGYVLDKKRLENGQIFDEEYFEHLLDEIREIRASERKILSKDNGYLFNGRRLF